VTEQDKERPGPDTPEGQHDEGSSQKEIERGDLQDVTGGKNAQVPLPPPPDGGG